MYLHLLLSVLSIMNFDFSAALYKNVKDLLRVMVGIFCANIASTSTAKPSS